MRSLIPWSSLGTVWVSFPPHLAECLSLQSGPIVSSRYHNTVNDIIKTIRMGTEAACNSLNHSVYVQKHTLCLGAAMGSEKAKNGKARFMKPFLNVSSFLWPCTILSSSRHTKPTTAAVVVAMAGMILPAMSLLCIKEGVEINIYIKCYGYHHLRFQTQADTTHLVPVCWRNVIILCS